MFRHVKTCGDHISLKFENICERIMAIRRYCKVQESSHSNTMAAVWVPKWYNFIHIYAALHVLREYSLNRPATPFKTVSQEAVPCCKKDCSISQENYTMRRSCSRTTWNMAHSSARRGQHCKKSEYNLHCLIFCPCEKADSLRFLQTLVQTRCSSPPHLA